MTINEHWNTFSDQSAVAPKFTDINFTVTLVKLLDIDLILKTG